MPLHPNDVSLLREFIGKCPNFLKDLDSSTPHCVGVTMEERAVTGSEAEGWRNCIAHIRAKLTDPKSNATDPKFIDQSK